MPTARGGTGFTAARVKGGPKITTNHQTDEGRNRSIRTCKTLKIGNMQLKTSLDVPMSDAAADVLWRIIDRARKTHQP
ncbi:hypothetical protein Q0Z83_026660 [Actinoplanes sichuanensis]|nr:hypothetical protein Q0Z83_026660 [Actinoplanes sichuanensis]